MRLLLFDDRVAGRWRPFALTRPAGELLFGVLRLRERLERWAGTEAGAHVVRRPGAASFAEPGAPPALTPESAASDEPGPRLLLSSRFVPSSGDGGPELRERERPATLTCGGEVVGCLLPAGRPAPGAAWLERPALLEEAPALELEGRVLSEVWELVTENPGRTARDLAAGLAPGDGRPLTDVEVVGAGPALAAGDVRVEPGVVADTRDGPVWLGEGVEVTAGTRLEGPLYVGPRSRLLGGKISRSSAGPLSYLHGEVEESVVLGYANKSHHGFLGHSYVGRWVNLGAGTTNSDLKNNYSPVRLAGPDGGRETGVQKLGVFLGDHVKTGIGTLLTGGAVLGAGSNVYGGGMAPKWVPPFSWGRPGRLGTHRRADFLETAARVLPRRGVEPTDDVLGWLEDAWEAARG